MTDHNQKVLDGLHKRAAGDGVTDEADTIRKFSPGDDNTASPGSNQNNNRIDFGGFLVWIFAALAMALAFAAFMRSSDSVRITERATEAAIRAAGEAARAREHGEALDNRMKEVVMEKRLEQEDLIMLRAAVRAHGIEVGTSGDHE